MGEVRVFTQFCASSVRCIGTWGFSSRFRSFRAANCRGGSHEWKAEREARPRTCAAQPPTWRRALVKRNAAERSLHVAAAERPAATLRSCFY